MENPRPHRPGKKIAGTNRATVLVVSPHLDDAVLSIGAYLADHAATSRYVELHTLFAGDPAGELSPAARTFHRLCGLGADAVRHRRAEDIAAAEALGVVTHHHGFLDAIYRRNTDGGWLCENERSVFAELPAEPELSTKLVATITELCVRRRPPLVLTCAAIGGHVDHRLTHQAVVEATSRVGARLMLWEDLPHAIRRPDNAIHGRPYPHYAAHVTWERKWSAIACYGSQAAMLWPDGRDWRAELTAHAVERGGSYRPAEMLWEPR
ncbi:MAG: PIG-L deacetylase family protein [Micromonosporaceae bacterium]